jgi:hypothetical protein
MLILCVTCVSEDPSRSIGGWYLYGNQKESWRRYQLDASSGDKQNRKCFGFEGTLFFSHRNRIKSAKD